jgi:peptidylprolyl isomerase
MPSMQRLFLIVFAISALALAGCGGGDDSASTAPPAAEESTAAEQAEAPEEKTKPQVKPPQSPPPKKVETKELEEGSGPAAKPGDQVTVQYVGVNYRTGSEFDASWDRGEPFTFTLGAHEVISGWDIGIKGMKVGGRRELIIPPNHAYGSTGSPPAIPPSETLIFVVDLEAIN